MAVHILMGPGGWALDPPVCVTVHNVGTAIEL